MSNQSGAAIRRAVQSKINEKYNNYAPQRAFNRDYLIKDGVVNTENMNNLLKDLAKKYEFDPVGHKEAVELLNQNIDMNRISGHNLKVSEYLSSLSSGNIERMFANAGYSLREAADEIGVSEMDLLSEENWSGNKLTINGKSWEFKFQYDDSVWAVL